PGARPAARHALSRPDWRRPPPARTLAGLFANPRHARLYRDAKGQWHIANHKSLNGVWLRLVQPQPIETACQFQLGEQRFLLRVL
ncbi:MAG: FHA domain-containing protein, partial [Gemmataceae bacterium]|nr:FHA domain-containing protein [Gemmataceae bacterium]